MKKNRPCDRLDCGRELRAFAEECAEAARSSLEEMFLSICENDGIHLLLQERRDCILRKIRLLKKLDRNTNEEILSARLDFRRCMRAFRSDLKNPERHSLERFERMEADTRTAWEMLVDAEERRLELQRRECGSDAFGHYLKVSLLPSLGRIESIIKRLTGRCISIPERAFEALQRAFHDDERLNICVYSMLSVLNDTTSREFFRDRRFGYSERMDFLECVREHFPMSLYDQFEPFHILMRERDFIEVDERVVQEIYRVFVAYTKERFRYACLIAFNEHLKRRRSFIGEGLDEIPDERPMFSFLDLEDERLSDVLGRHLSEGILREEERMALCEHLLSHLGDLNGYLSATTCPEKFLIPAGVHRHLSCREIGEISHAIGDAFLEISKSGRR